MVGVKMVGGKYLGERGWGPRRADLIKIARKRNIEIMKMPV